MVKDMDKIDSIDRSFYNKLIDEAVDEISKYGDFEWFVSDESAGILNNGLTQDETMPFA